MTFAHVYNEIQKIKIIQVKTHKSYHINGYRNWWPWMTLNGVMAFILPYFT